MDNCNMPSSQCIVFNFFFFCTQLSVHLSCNHQKNITKFLPVSFEDSLICYMWLLNLLQMFTSNLLQKSLTLLWETGMFPLRIEHKVYNT